MVSFVPEEVFKQQTADMGYGVVKDWGPDRKGYVDPGWSDQFHLRRKGLRPPEPDWDKMGVVSSGVSFVSTLGGTNNFIDLFNRNNEPPEGEWAIADNAYICSGISITKNFGIGCINVSI